MTQMGDGNECGSSGVDGAIELLKSYLTRPEFRIILREMVWRAVEDLTAELTSENSPIDCGVSETEYITRIQKLESISERSVALIVNGSFWGEPKDDDVWLTQLRRLASVDACQGGNRLYINLFHYPALLSMYGAGIAAISRERYQFLKAVLLTRCRPTEYRGTNVLVDTVFPTRGINGDIAQKLLPSLEYGKQYKTPISRYLQHVIRPFFVNLIPSDGEFLESFDRFEYLASLISNDVTGGRRNVVGSFAWRQHGASALVSEIFAQEFDTFKDQWAPLREGLFGGSSERFQSAKAKIDARADRFTWH